MNDTISNKVNHAFNMTLRTVHQDSNISAGRLNCYWGFSQLSLLRWSQNFLPVEEKRKDKAMKRSDTDDLWTKIESLQWVLFVIFAIKNERMVVI